MFTLYHHHRTQCIPLIENYDQGLRKEERRQLIPIEESMVKESLGSRKVFKGRETCTLQIEEIEYVQITKNKDKSKEEGKER